MALVCHHIRKSVNTGQACPPHNVVEADMFDDPELVTKSFLCEPCAHNFGLKPNVIVDEIHDGLEPVCAKCLFDSIKGPDKAA